MSSAAPHARELSLLDPSRPVRFWEKWSPGALVKILACFALCLAGFSVLPPKIWNDQTNQAVWLLGAFGIWRYTWWTTHLVRSKIYGRWVYPRLAREAAAVWNGGWRPRRVHILLTTYRENRATAEAVVRSICNEIRSIGRPATIWIGSRDLCDEQVLANHFKLVGSDLDIELRIIRQRQPGKRIAIALILSAMAREGLGSQDLVAFMDSDFVLEKGALPKCLALFAADPTLHAVTTDEDVAVQGPDWVRSWLSMRFAQRRLTMQSHALSGRVLTLTGRFSVFRATYITSPEFIQLLKADYLGHWLWGTFRFLSGDDKSSWYALLKRNVKMLYVPDARGYTVEIIEGDGIRRMVDNLRRWSGNMLRNGARAIALGPQRMPVFIWWCLIDQRIAMWTMLLGPLFAIIVALNNGIEFLLAYLLYVVLTRLFLAIVLFTYSRRVDLNYIWCLYANQVLNAVVKVYTIWRLPQQRWANRGDQRLGVSGGRVLRGLRHAMAVYLTVLSIAALLLGALVSTRSVAMPSLSFIKVLQAEWHPSSR